MMLLRLLNPQGLAGLAATACLAVLLLLQKGETHHWKKQSASFEQLYRAEQLASAATVANYRAAADQARAADRANANRVLTEQRAINERTSNDFEARISAARNAAAQRLRGETSGPATDPGDRRGAAVPGLSAAATSTAEGPGEDRLPESDALTATEQAIQLDELIKWVKAQSAVATTPQDSKPR